MGSIFASDNCIWCINNNWKSQLPCCHWINLHSFNCFSPFMQEYLPPATKLGGKVMFLHVSVILFTGGGCLPQSMLGCTPRRTPPRETPPGRPPQEDTRNPPLEQCMLGDTGNKRAVYILLECILVKVDFLITLGRIRSLLPPHVFNCAKFDCFCSRKSNV